MSDELIHKSDELIRKSEVIKAIKRVLGGYCMGSAVAGAINEIQPVNAVELPCEIGDILFEVCVVCGGIHKREVHGFNIRENGMFIVCDTTNFEKREIGKQVFSSRGEAEEALVLRQCFQQTMTEENENEQH